jgi:hypothetical protein
MRVRDDQDKPLPRWMLNKHFPLIAGGLACVLFGALMALGVHMLWQLDNTPVTGGPKERMMHQKTRTMMQISDGLVRGDLRRVESSAENMWRIGQSLNWHMSGSLYGDNNRIFRDTTRELLEAARQRDHTVAKESALRLERSCIECHELINR